MLHDPDEVARLGERVIALESEVQKLRDTLNELIDGLRSAGRDARAALFDEEA